LATCTAEAREQEEGLWRISTEVTWAKDECGVVVAKGLLIIDMTVSSNQTDALLRDEMDTASTTPYGFD
jgi:hypothetical protein